MFGKQSAKMHGLSHGFECTDMYSILRDYATNENYKIFIDIGVQAGHSSKVLIQAAYRTKGKVYGIDFGYCKVNPPTESNYKFIYGESVTIGSKWKYERPDFIFVDATHVKEWVMCELFFWWDLLNIGGTIGFHDTNWDYGRMDRWCGIEYNRVEDGIKQFFKISDLYEENENLISHHLPFGDGLTFILKKKEFDFKSKEQNWKAIFGVREQIIKCILKFRDKASEYCDNSGVICRENLTIEMH